MFQHISDKNLLITMVLAVLVLIATITSKIKINEFSYDKQGRVCAIKRIIHVFNKNETTLEHLPIYDKLLNT